MYEHVVTRRVKLDFHEGSEEPKELDESHRCNRRVGSTWTVASSFQRSLTYDLKLNMLTSVDFRVWSSLRDGGHGGENGLLPIPRVKEGLTSVYLE